MQDKDEELQTIYRRLSEACKERSDVRSALISTQSELAETQAELDAWTHELDTFQQVGFLSSHRSLHTYSTVLASLLTQRAMSLHGISCSPGCRLFDNIIFSSRRNEPFRGLQMIRCTLAWMHVALADEDAVLTDRHLLQALLSVPEDPAYLNGASQMSSGPQDPPVAQSKSVSNRETEVAELGDKTKDMLQKLSDLSNSLVRDAKEDDEVFRAGHRQSLD